MKHTHKIPMLIAFAFGFLTTSAQENKAGSFSLQEAIDYALAHNQNYKNAELDVKAAEYKNKEVTGIGLPQINGSADLKDYLSIPTSLIPAEIFGGPPGTFQPVKFGTKYNSTFGVAFSQIIFNGEYLVGLEAAKEFVSLSEKNLQRNKVETYATITKAYYLAVLTKERLKVIDANLERVKKLFDDTKAMNIAGMAEKLEVDRVELTYNNLMLEKEKNLRGVGYTETLLKFQMGYELQNSIILTDVISEALLIEVSLPSETKVNYEDRPDYSMLQIQLNINNLDLKRNRYLYLPSLSAYGSFQKQAQRTEFDVFNIDQPWFGIGLIGASLNVPIFNGGQKHFKIEQSKINVAKTSNSLNYMKTGIDLEVENYVMLYKNALSGLESQRKNKVLAENIFNVSKIKYQSGVGTNMDVVIAQAAFRDAEINFLNAVFELLLAKTDYLKATGTLVK